MAWQLVADVLDHAPADLTAGELAVLVAIAEWARPTTRETERPAVEVARRARQKVTGLQATLSRLAARGLEVRVPLRTGRDGRPIFAVPGTVTRYRLPTFPAPAGCPCEACRQGSALADPARAEGSATTDPVTPEGSATASARVGHSMREGRPQPTPIRIRSTEYSPTRGRAREAAAGSTSPDHPAAGLADAAPAPTPAPAPQWPPAKLPRTAERRQALAADTAAAVVAERLGCPPAAAAAVVASVLAAEDKPNNLVTFVEKIRPDVLRRHLPTPTPPPFRPSPPPRGSDEHRRAIVAASRAAAAERARSRSGAEHGDAAPDRSDGPSPAPTGEASAHDLEHVPPAEVSAGA